MHKQAHKHVHCTPKPVQSATHTRKKQFLCANFPIAFAIHYDALNRSVRLCCCFSYDLAVDNIDIGILHVQYVYDEDDVDEKWRKKAKRKKNLFPFQTKKIPEARGWYLVSAFNINITTYGIFLFVCFISFVSSWIFCWMGYKLETKNRV